MGTAAAFVSLNIETLVVSPLPMGRGMTRGSHGPIPLPAPATLSLLLGAPIIETNLEGETVTPTGAALIMTLVNRFGAMPTMLLRKVGVGAGHRDWPDRPNVVRAMIGDSENVQILTSDDDVIIETNIDDMTAEQLASLQERIQSGGAIDAWSTPVYGKKGRIGQKLSALVSRNLVVRDDGRPSQSPNSQTGDLKATALQLQCFARPLRLWACANIRSGVTGLTEKL